MFLHDFLLENLSKIKRIHFHTHKLPYFFYVLKSKGIALTAKGKTLHKICEKTGFHLPVFSRILCSEKQYLALFKYEKMGKDEHA